MARNYFNTAGFDWCDEFPLGDVNYVSRYNHNYYYNEDTDTLVLEVCDDCDLFEYYQINEDGTRTDLGATYADVGIFEDLDVDVAELVIEEF